MGIDRPRVLVALPRHAFQSVKNAMQPPIHATSTIRTNLTSSWHDRLVSARIVAVLAMDDPANAAPLAAALQEGGIRAVELTLRSPNAMGVLRAMRAAAPELLLGAGTVLTAAQADAVKDAGADFALAPGFDHATVRHCAVIGLPFVPGIATASELQAALAAGCRLLKVFPAEALGGISGLRMLAKPFSHQGVCYFPIGGIDLAKASAYLAEPGVVAIGGSWIADPELIRSQAWGVIRRRASEAAAVGRAGVALNRDDLT